MLYLEMDRDDFPAALVWAFRLSERFPNDVNALTLVATVAVRYVISKTDG